MIAPSVDLPARWLAVACGRDARSRSAPRLGRRRGRCRSTIGARGAVWAPATGLASIVVLDEHDEALQEERNPTWHARDVAIERAPPCRDSRAAGVAGSDRWPRRSGRHRVAVPLVERRACRLADRRGRRPVARESRGVDLTGVVAADRPPARRRSTVVCVLNSTGPGDGCVCRTCSSALRAVRGSGAWPPTTCSHCGRCGRFGRRSASTAARGAFAALRGASAGSATSIEAAAGRPVGGGHRARREPVPRRRCATSAPRRCCTVCDARRRRRLPRLRRRAARAPLSGRRAGDGPAGPRRPVGRRSGRRRTSPRADVPAHTRSRRRAPRRPGQRVGVPERGANCSAYPPSLRLPLLGRGSRRVRASRRRADGRRRRATGRVPPTSPDVGPTRCGDLGDAAPKGTIARRGRPAREPTPAPPMPASPTLAGRLTRTRAADEASRSVGKHPARRASAAVSRLPGVVHHQYGVAVGRQTRRATSSAGRGVAACRFGSAGSTRCSSKLTSSGTSSGWATGPGWSPRWRARSRRSASARPVDVDCPHPGARGALRERDRDGAGTASEVEQVAVLRGRRRS